MLNANTSELFGLAITFYILWRECGCNGSFKQILEVVIISIACDHQLQLLKLNI